MFADFTDVQARYPEVISDQRAIYIATVVDDANAVLATKLPDLETRVANNPNLARLAKMVVVNAVVRATDNPHDFTSESVGGFSYGRNPRQNVWFRDDELDLLAPAVLPVGTIYMELGPQYQPDGYGARRTIDTEAWEREHIPHHTEY